MKTIRRAYSSLFFCAFLFLMSAAVKAQTPGFVKNTGATNTNAFAWGQAGLAKKTQLLYLPQNFFPAPVSGHINKLYFMYGNGGQSTSHVYTNLTIKLGQTSNTAFPASLNFYSGLTTVLSSSAYTINAGNIGTWFEIPLTTAFYHETGKSLIVEISFEKIDGSTTATGLTTYAGASVTGQKVYSVTTTATVGMTNTGLQNFGFDIVQSSCTAPPTPGFATSSTAVCPGESMQLGLTGQSLGINQNYVWESSSTLAGPYTAFSAASPSPQLFVNPLITTYYRAAVTCNGQTSYSQPTEGLVIQPLSGNYTINPALPASATNFRSLGEAANKVNCGIAGPVIITFVAGSGPYNEQVTINQFNGSSATNTVTFKGNLNIVTFATTNEERAVIKLNGADNVILDSLIINPTGNVYGYGVQLLNDADNNSISHCEINNLGIPSGSSTNFGGIISNTSATASITQAGENRCDNNTISNNRITKVSVGIAFTANRSTYVVNNNKILNNKLIDFDNYGIYLNGNNNTLIEGNDISRPTRTLLTTPYFYGIHLNDSNTNCRISRNRIHSSADSVLPCNSIGISFLGADAKPGQENLVYNNLIYHFTGNGFQNGILISGSDHAKFFHNTILLENETPGVNSSSSTRGFNVTLPVSHVEFKNNIIKVSRETPSDKTGIFITPGSAWDPLESTCRHASLSIL